MIHVVAAAVFDGAGRVLIAQRPAGKHMAGLWEFPGGKLEPGEARVEGLKRELAEEIGITIEHPRPLLRLKHAYSHGEVLLDIWIVRRYRGEPRGLDGQALRWCGRSALGAADLLPADRPIIAALRLPERLQRRETRDYVLDDVGRFAAPGSGASGAEGIRAAGRLRGVLCGTAEEAREAVSQGAQFIALRSLPGRAELTALCDALPVPVYVPGMTPQRAWELGASGSHEVE